MIKKHFSIFLLTSLVLFTGFNPVFAQTTILQKTLNTIEDLINAKDSDVESLAFRIQTFNQVVDLSISEAKELRIKLLSLEGLDATNTSWLKENIVKMDEAMKYYEEQKKLVATQNPITVTWVKNAAKEFKKWREENYLPAADQLLDFLLINQEKKAIETAKLRLQKITRDLGTLEKRGIKNLEPISKLLEKAGKSINEGVDLNLLANEKFWQNQILTTSTSTATTTPDIATNPKLETVTSTVTTTATSTVPEVKEPTPQPSIRDLVRDSLNKIKEAYQIFIEMSNLVRKLLI